MDRLHALSVFVRIVESGSFTLVARERGVAQSTISKQLSALESYLGAQLLHRNSRGLSPTEAGHRYYEMATKLLAELEAVESSVSDGQSLPTGVLRITLSAAFGRLHVMPLLP